MFYLLQVDGWGKDWGWWYQSTENLHGRSQLRNSVTGLQHHWHPLEASSHSEDVTSKYSVLAAHQTVLQEVMMKSVIWWQCKSAPSLFLAGWIFSTVAASTSSAKISEVIDLDFLENGAARLVHFNYSYVLLKMTSNFYPSLCSRFLWTWHLCWLHLAPFIFFDGYPWRNACYCHLSSPWLVLSQVIEPSFSY